ncbi:agamous-like MADS-box protein AGL30 isoform X1 [Magnolia sinica]|uniref:agamous-like MADS-box protein AGL30 isoform X1 n=1 Tax=Magnolia sinica TaxID=86752 RepID=UPI00265AB5CE|nr:agamous-like MADS-box protein AGL30 isoform X1 [Magnolia sinica]
MGKAIKMERLKTANARQNTFSKRKNGIIKKARELSILCDVDVLVLMFSPAGKPTLYVGEYSNISMVLARFSGISIRERARRKCEVMEVRPNSSFLRQKYACSVAVKIIYRFFDDTSGCLCFLT